MLDEVRSASKESKNCLMAEVAPEAKRLNDDRHAPSGRSTKRRSKTKAQRHAHWVCVRVSRLADASHLSSDNWQPSVAGIITDRLAQPNGRSLYGVDGICIFGRTAAAYSADQDDSMLVLLTSSTGTMSRYDQQVKVHSWLNHATVYTCTAFWPSQEAVSGLLQLDHPERRQILGGLNGPDKCRDNVQQTITAHQEAQAQLQGAAARSAPAAAATQTTLPHAPDTAAAAFAEANSTCAEDTLKVVIDLMKQAVAPPKRGGGATIPKLEAATHAVSIYDWKRVVLEEHVTVMRRFLVTGLCERLCDNQSPFPAQKISNSSKRSRTDASRTQEDLSKELKEEVALAVRQNLKTYVPRASKLTLVTQAAPVQTKRPEPVPPLRLSGW